MSEWIIGNFNEMAHAARKMGLKKFSHLTPRRVLRANMLAFVFLLAIFFAYANANCLEPTHNTSFECPYPASLVRDIEEKTPLCGIIYKHINCKGNNMELMDGQVITNLKTVGFNDEVSSVVVREGCTLTIWQDASYKSKSMCYHGGHYQNLKDLSFNDESSSLRCTCCQAKAIYEKRMYCSNNVSGQIYDCMYDLHAGITKLSGPMKYNNDVAIKKLLETYISGSFRDTWLDYSLNVHHLSMNNTLKVKMSAQSRFFIEQLVAVCDYIKVFSTEFRIRTIGNPHPNGFINTNPTQHP